MARLFWFAAGAVAGLAYASQLVNKERLNLPPGVEAPIEPPTEKGPDLKTKIANMIDQRTDQILTMVDERLIALTDKLHTAGHELASSIRGDVEQPEVMVIDTITLYTEPVETPVTANAAASTTSSMGASTPSAPGPSPRSTTTDTGTSQADTGFETNR